jgi:hypothetical protein
MMSPTWDADAKFDPDDLRHRSILLSHTALDINGAAYRIYDTAELSAIASVLDRVQSSRRLEREAGRNLEVMWLTGRLVPDHKTIADFRRDNGPAIKRVSACA